MERESFEKDHVAEILNKDFVCIKVDKEERPDVDSIYMKACLAFTGSGGWPTSIFMTGDQKPFYVGTYFPRQKFVHLLKIVNHKWHNNREDILSSADEALKLLDADEAPSRPGIDYITEAFNLFQRSFDKEYGGFGKAPKFPCPHNFVFLLEYYKLTKNEIALNMAEKTLIQMYKGGIFDHIGYGFSRYSTDRLWLAPHFEKMLYDNALLCMAYLRAYELTGNELYKSVTDKTVEYVQKELTNPQGGFYSAQDADSEGEEGKYYIFEPEEIIKILGKEIGEKYNAYFDITPKGNFEGKNIPNLIKQDHFTDEFDEYLPKLYEYRLNRFKLHKDDKILTSWNGLMIAALADGYRILGDNKYLYMAEKAVEYAETHLADGNTLYVSAKDNRRSVKGFLDDYACYIFALIQLYQACFNEKYLDRALELNQKVIYDYYDKDKGGFYIYGTDNEQLIVKPKETYDGAIPSGNSIMYYNLSRLYKLTKDQDLYNLTEKQQKFMESSINYPLGNSFFILSTLPTKDIVCVLKNKDDINSLKIKSHWVFRLFKEPTGEYPLINDKTTYYVCDETGCKPPTNELNI